MPNPKLPSIQKRSCAKMATALYYRHCGSCQSLLGGKGNLSFPHLGKSACMYVGSASPAPIGTDQHGTDVTQGQRRTLGGSKICRLSEVGGETRQGKELWWEWGGTLPDPMLWVEKPCPNWCWTGTPCCTQMHLWHIYNTQRWQYAYTRAEKNSGVVTLLSLLR